jgi:hypothetical protein
VYNIPKPVIMLRAFIFLIVLFPTCCFAQVTISGRVLNQSDTKPVANASVFLSNASVGNKTANDGSFILHNVKPGKYELVVSIIGFEAYHQTLMVNNNNITLPDITIIPKTIALQEVNIKSAYDPNREKNFDLFEKEFLGSSDFAKDCKIVNPELLDLNYNEATNILTASSVDFLEIENAALGYKIKYLLTNFMLDNKDPNAQKIHFEGSALFQEMKGTPLQERRWQNRRQLVYEGSEMHFLRSALSNTLDEDGFRVLQLITYPNSPKTKLPKLSKSLMQFPLKAEEIIKLSDQQGIYALGCDNDKLHITYSKNHHFPKSGQLAQLNYPDNTETTIISFNMPYVFFDRNGGVIDPNSLSITGAWGRNRIAELLPVDYEPPQSKNLLDKRTILSSPATTQPSPLADSLLKITTASDSSIKNRPVEKIYVQFDKPYYAVGDTIWFKAYLFNAPTMGLSAKSGIMYFDIANDSNTFTKQYRLPVKEGLSRGNISLSEFPPGNYTLRAYTNWMRNFGADCFFYKRFMVADDQEQTWLANSQTVTSVAEGKLQANVKLQLSDMNKTAVADKLVLLEVMAGTHHLYKQQVQTDGKGMLDVNFKVPDKSTGLSLVASDEQRGNKITIPINLNRADHTDVQFLPEGGNLIAGLPTHIGFKAIGEDGKGINISGIITDHNKTQVASFQSLHNGMGSFELTSQSTENYTAKVNLPDGTVKEYQLPAIKSTGTVLNVTNPLDKDSVMVSLATTNDLIQSGENFFLIGKSRGIICYGAVLNFKDGNIRRNIAKKLFPSGITHFILINTKGQPLNERLVFIDHHDNLHIDLTTYKQVYAPRDSVAMHITVTDSTGAPVAGNFSFAVTDDAQVKQDTLNSENIITRLLLTADLKGYIEEPGYYLQAKSDQTWRALDNLLLTQGWVSYDWQADKQHPEFVAEDDFTVKGQVQNGFNQSVKGTHVTLLSKSPVFVRDTITDKDGRFTFRNFPMIDTPAFIIKAVNKHDKSFNVGIVMDDVKPPVFTTLTGQDMQPWYLSNDTALLNTAKNNRIRIEQKYFDPNSHTLKEVKITAKKVVKGSQNLNGPGNADLVLDEKDMLKAAKKTLLDMLKENIKGFRTESIKDYITRFFVQDKSFGDVQGTTINSYPSPYFQWFFVEDKPVKFIIDGIPFGSNMRSTDLGTPNISDLTTFLQYHNAEDIKGIELNSTIKYSGDYFRRYLPADWPAGAPPNDWKTHLHAFDFAYIEITTRSGRGPVIDNTPGRYLYKPLAFSWPKQFYKPKYIVSDATKHLPDTRSTIDWEPNIVTDKKGKAIISFYAADKPATYTIIMEGSDGNGNLGYKNSQIVVNRKTPVNTQKPESK